MKCETKCQEKALSSEPLEQKPSNPNLVSYNGHRWESVDSLGRSVKSWQEEMPEEAPWGARFPPWHVNSFGDKSS